MNRKKLSYGILFFCILLLFGYIIFDHFQKKSIPRPPVVQQTSTEKDLDVSNLKFYKLGPSKSEFDQKPKKQHKESESRDKDPNELSDSTRELIIMRGEIDRIYDSLDKQ